MPPLNRQQTPTSIHSWWSDSNPGLRGPTINLHAASKPLMRLMYHRQALNLIQKNSGVSLSAETLEVFSSYLPLEYVLPSTKAAILVELSNRADMYTAEEDVLIIAQDTFVLQQIAKIVGSKETSFILQQRACELLGKMGRSTVPFPAELSPCRLLVSLLRNENADLVTSALNALFWCSHWLNGAKAAVDAKALDYVPELLESTNQIVRTEACKLLENLAEYKPLIPAILRKQPLVVRLVCLCGEEDSLYHVYARQALDYISKYLTADAKGVDLVLVLVGSPKIEARRWTCEIIETLTRDKSTRLTLLEEIICVPLVSRLSQEQDIGILRSIICSLSQISRRTDGSRALISTNVLDYVPKFLDSPNVEIRQCSCELLGNLSCHESTAPAILASICGQLMHLLRDKNDIVSGEAEDSLNKIMRSSEGAQAAINAKVVQRFSREDDAWILKPVICTLSQIARQMDGSRALIAANVLDYVPKLLDSPNVEVRQCSCELLENLSCHESTAPGILASICGQLVRFLRDKNAMREAADSSDNIMRSSEGAQAAIDAKVVQRFSREDDAGILKSIICSLSHVARQMDGSRALIGTKMLDYVLKLLNSPNVEIRLCSCELLENLSSHKSMAPKILVLICGQLVRLLRDHNAMVSGKAADSLIVITRRNSPDVHALLHHRPWASLHPNSRAHGRNLVESPR
ncbi:armadillo-type protein [Mycena galericulata]|nr:armadillo-type protein [Mycena galericulata]